VELSHEVVVRYYLCTIVCRSIQPMMSKAASISVY